MSDILTKDEYRALADAMTMPTGAFIDGKFQAAASAKSFASHNPATGEALAQVPACDAVEVDLAVQKARECFEEGHWRAQHPSARKAVLIKLAKLIARNRHELAVLESLDSGKPIADVASVDIPETVECIKWHAEAIDKIYDQSAPTGEDALSIIVREPIGVVAAVLPWNFPLLMMAWKIAPALAAGNSVIVKPAEQTSLSALRLAELALQAGIPRGALSVVTGMGPDVGQPLGQHHDIDMVSFTGSTETGKRFLRYAADSNLKKVVLECGGKNPFVVLKDAAPVDLIAQHLVNAAFWNMGENCSAASRLIVHKAQKAPLLEAIATRLRQWKTGDPLDPQNQLGCMIDAEHFAKVKSYLEGATCLIGGETLDDRYIVPTVIDEVAASDKLAREEIFGPVLSVITAGSDQEALAIANDCDYGLSASLFTRDVKAAMRGARAIRAGTVTVNCYGEGSIATPFGGYKQSGFGGRDNSLHAHDQYTELKTIWLDLSDDDVDGAL